MAARANKIRSDTFFLSTREQGLLNFVAYVTNSAISQYPPSIRTFRFTFVVSSTYDGFGKEAHARQSVRVDEYFSGRPGPNSF